MNVRGIYLPQTPDPIPTNRGLGGVTSIYAKRLTRRCDLHTVRQNKHRYRHCGNRVVGFGEPCGDLIARWGHHIEDETGLLNARAETITLAPTSF